MNIKQEEKDMISKSSWWGDYELVANQTLCWQIGPKVLWISRGDKEWKVTSKKAHDPLEIGSIVSETANVPDGDDIDVAEAAMNPPGNTPFDLVELEEMGFWAEVEDDNRRAIQVANDSVSNA